MQHRVVLKIGGNQGTQMVGFYIDVEILKQIVEPLNLGDGMRVQDASSYAPWNTYHDVAVGDDTWSVVR